MPVDVSKLEPGIYSYKFTPETSGRHYISAAVGNIAVENTPFMVNILIYKKIPHIYEVKKKLRINYAVIDYYRFI